MSHIVHTFIREINICLPYRKKNKFGLYLVLIEINYTQPYFRNVIYTLALNVLTFFLPINEFPKSRKGKWPSYDILQT